MISVKNSFEIAYNGTENECRFELYADTASDLQGLTHIDGIKIQMGSECTDIATGDKYILNGSGAWILQPSDCAFSNVYTKAEIDSMITEIYGIIAYYHTTLVSDTGEITFYSLGGNVGTWAIYGNGQQIGKPTPDNPVMPEFAGARTGNLWDEEYTDISQSLTYKPIFVGDGQYTLSTTTPFEGGTANLFFIAGNVSSGASTITNGVYINREITVTAIDGYVTIVYRSQTVNPNGYDTMLNSGSTALPYEPFGYKIPLTCAGQTVPVYLGQTQTVRRVRKLVMTSTTVEWAYDSTYNRYAFKIADSLIVGVCLSPVACSHFVPITDGRSIGDVPNNAIYSNSREALNNWFIKTTDYTTASSFKQFLDDELAAGHPVTVWYVLNTPETGIVNEPLAKIGDYADELNSTDTGVTIPTVSGENTLTVDTDLIPSKIVISGGE